MRLAESKNRQRLPLEKYKLASALYLRKSIASSRGNDDPLRNQNTGRSRRAWDVMREQRRRLCLEFWPAYAPELSPISVVALEATWSCPASVPRTLVP